MSRGLYIVSLLLGAFAPALTISAQSPVQWEFTSKKIAGNKFEIQLTATIKNGWHIYAIKQPPSSVAVPTSVRFSKNPLIKFQGGLKQLGELQKVKEEELEIESWQFTNQVSFVQIIEIKAKASTNVSGSVEFQACTEGKCLPAKTLNFDIRLSIANP